MTFFLLYTCNKSKLLAILFWRCFYYFSLLVLMINISILFTVSCFFPLCCWHVAIFVFIVREVDWDRNYWLFELLFNKKKTLSSKADNSALHWPIYLQNMCCKSTFNSCLMQYILVIILNILEIDSQLYVLYKNTYFVQRLNIFTSSENGETCLKKYMNLGLNRHNSDESQPFEIQNYEKQHRKEFQPDFH